MKFVLHLHDNILPFFLVLSVSRLLPLTRRGGRRRLTFQTTFFQQIFSSPAAPSLSAIFKTIRMCHPPQTTPFAISSTSIKCHTRKRVLFGLKTGMNSFRNDSYRNETSSRCHVNRYRETYGDGMNSFRNESHSGIM